LLQLPTQRILSSGLINISTEIISHGQGPNH